MANEVDSELTSAVTDPSSGSLLGEKTTGEGGSIHQTASSVHPHESQPQTSVSENEKKTTLIPSSPQSGNDPQSESVKKEDNVDKPEKTGGDMHESGDGFKHTDEADEEKGDDKDHGQDYISDKKAELESVASLKEKTTPIPSSPQSGNDLQSESMKKEDNVDKPERTGDVGSSESPVKVEETEKASGINERGDGFKRTDEADEDEYQDQESPLQNIQRPKEAEKTRDINESGEHTDETDEETESLQPTASSGLPQDNQPQIRVGGNDKLFLTVGVLLLSCCVGLYFTDSTPPVPKAFSVLDVFNQEMEKVKTSFPNQRPELWRRSLIHLRRHLKTEQPTEPVSLILTSGHSAERTLGCLAKCLAQAFSTALNSSVLNINGKSKASQDSDQVKLDIDSELRNAFEGKKFAAVIHRFEELPPGSTLIFYRYCDHENAAYKNVFLAFTVMLDGEVEVPSSVNLGRVEEMVQEHVKQKFVSSDKLATFNQMDVDKLSGLWSRISHLILPVVVEEKIEHKGCGDCDK